MSDDHSTAMRAAHQLDMDAMYRQLLALQERNRQLEQTIKEGIDIIEHLYNTGRKGRVWKERAKALLEQEDNS